MINNEFSEEKRIYTDVLMQLTWYTLYPSHIFFSLDVKYTCNHRVNFNKGLGVFDNA